MLAWKPGREGTLMTAVGTWTGREARALRQALRLSVRSFAEHLDVAPRTVSKWEKLGEATRPYPEQQALLDTALDRADAAAQERFILLLNGSTVPAVRSPAVPAPWEYESWADDLDRAVAALSHQDFPATAMPRRPTGQPWRCSPSWASPAASPRPSCR
jgi:transcriptional regulator with XRE-family HTH domain